MVATEKRREAARLLLGYYKGSITNDTLLDSWPAAKDDPVLGQLGLLMVMWADDPFRERKIDPRARTDFAFARAVHRCLSFLRAGLEYQWVGSGVTEGLVPHLLELFNKRRLEVNQAGDQSVWPFYRKEDYKRAWKLAT